MRTLFPCPLYLVVTCSCYLPEEYTVASFPGDDSRNGFRVQHSSWFNSGYMFDAGLRACPAGSTGAAVERQLISHSCSPLTLGLGCAGQQVPQVQSARRQSRSHCCCSFMPELQYIDKVVDVPVVVLMPVVVQRQVL